MGRFALFCVAVAAIVGVVLPGSGVAAPIVSHSHITTEATFADNFCGIDGTSVVTATDNIQVFADNTFKDQVQEKIVFTATESGKSVLIHIAFQVSGNIDPIDNGDGTVTFVATDKGHSVSYQILDGPMLFLDAGVLVRTFVGFFDPDGTPHFTLTTSEHGPHPLFHITDAEFCAVIVPALT